jgi:hypothetical protein
LVRPYYLAVDKRKPFMLRTLTLVTGIGSFASFCSGQGQLTSVTFSPNNISECNLVMITINGNIPGGASPQSFGYSQVGNTITIPLLVSPGGGPASFSQPVGPFGPYAPGSYTFIIQMDVNGTIVDTETIVKVVTAGVNPDAGQFGSDTVCTSDPNFNLFTLLTGADPGGSWTDPLNQPCSATFDPGVSLEGYYTYSIEVLPPCTSAYQQVYVQYVPQTNDPGTSGYASVCQGGAPITLFSYLGGTPDPGGQWSFNGQNHGPQFNPLADQQGVYTYTLPGTAPCPTVSASVTVTLEVPPSAGTGNTVEVCENDSIFALSTGLTGTPNQSGTWYTGPFILGSYMVEIIPAINGGGIYTYIVTSPFCPSDTAYVEVVLLDSTSVDCTVGMEERMAGLDRFELLPNPTEGIVTMDLGSSDPLEDLRVEVLNADGRIAYTTNLRSEGQRTLRQVLDLSELRAGLYVVRVINSTGSASRRLVLR